MRLYNFLQKSPIILSSFELVKRHSINSTFCLSCGEDEQNALSLQVIFCKRALKLVVFSRKETYNLRHPMHFCHPVPISPSIFNRSLPTTSTERKGRCETLHSSNYLATHLFILSSFSLYLLCSYSNKCVPKHSNELSTCLCILHQSVSTLST